MFFYLSSLEKKSEFGKLIRDILKTLPKLFLNVF